jgi:hypothetical protein
MIRFKKNGNEEVRSPQRPRCSCVSRTCDRGSSRADPFRKNAAGEAQRKMPVVIVAGEEDRLVDINARSARLHGDVPRVAFTAFPKMPT